MGDQSKIPTGADRQEIAITRPIKLVELRAGIGQIKLEIENRSLDDLLLVVGQASQAVAKTITNSPWYIRIIAGLAM